MWRSPVSAHGWGPWGRRFKSCHPDFFFTFVIMKKLFLILIPFLLFNSCSELINNKTNTPNIILITLDGVRWQEVFNGIDLELIENKKFTKNAELLNQMFFDKNQKIRQQKLLPFFGNYINNHGLLIGNKDKESSIKLTNDQLFSYPGYNEILTGFADSSITSNNKIYNKNQTILELLNNTKNYSGKVAAFCSWDVFPYIINDKRSGVPVSAGYSNLEKNKLSKLESFIDVYQKMMPLFRYNVRYDLFTHILSMEHIKNAQPKFVYISYDETDSFSHDGSYDNYISSLHNTDKMIEELWIYLQQDSFYKNNTYMFITTDHGRGDGDFANSMWTSHGDGVEGCEDTWLAILGPGIKNKKIEKGKYYVNQIAPTIAKLAGISIEDSRAGSPILIN